MVETEAISSLISSWLTPTYLFILLNIVLATILLLNNHHQSKNHDNNNEDNSGEVDGASLVPPPPQLTRAPSLFSRVASFNFSSYYSESHVLQPDNEPDRTTVTTVTRAPSLLYRVASFNFCRAAPQESAAADGGQGNSRKGNDVNEISVSSSVSVKTTREDKVVQRPKEEAFKVKKVNSNGNSNSNKKKKVKKGENVVVAQEVKKDKETTSYRGEDEQVDSKADDFINRFKQNLKMQRLDSLLRYRNYNTVAA